MTIRIIPRLDIKGPNLVKGIHLEGLRILGSPDEYAQHYYAAGADELLYMDAVASLYGRNSLNEIVEKTARSIFVPLTVGGGLRSLEDIVSVLRVGADKVALNSAATKNPDFIAEAANRFGSSTITISIEAKHHKDGRVTAFIDNGREDTGRDVLGWARQCAELGAGEIIVTSIDQEGTGRGFAIDLLKTICEAVPIPVIASGGAGNIAHVGDVVREAGVGAVGLASILHYGLIKSLDEDNYKRASGGDFPVIKEKYGQSYIAGATLPEIKDYLVSEGYDCRF